MMDLSTMNFEALNAAIMGAPAEDKFYSLYNGEVKLYFDEDAHVYFLLDEHGVRTNVSGVTDSVHIVDKSDALCPWAAKKTVEYMRENTDLARTYTPDEFEQLLDKAKAAHREYKENAADIGHIAHNWIELYIKALIEGDHALEMQYLHNLPEHPQAAQCCRAALNWMLKHTTKWLHAERKVLSRRWNYAGTVDGVCLMSACGDAECCGYLDTTNDPAGEWVPYTFKNVMAVADWKSCNGLYDEYNFQTAAYLEAVCEELGYDITYRSINRLGKEDGEFEARLRVPETLDDDFGAFLDCLALSRRVRARKAREYEEKSRLRAALKVRKEREKEVKELADLTRRKNELDLENAQRALEGKKPLKPRGKLVEFMATPEAFVVLPGMSGIDAAIRS